MPSVLCIIIFKETHFTFIRKPQAVNVPYCTSINFEKEKIQEEMKL